MYKCNLLSLAVGDACKRIFSFFPAERAVLLFFFFLVFNYNIILNGTDYTVSVCSSIFLVHIWLPRFGSVSGDDQSKVSSRKFESTIIIIYFVNSLYENNKNKKWREKKHHTQVANSEQFQCSNEAVSQKAKCVCVFEEPWLIVYFIEIV